MSTLHSLICVGPGQKCIIICIEILHKIEYHLNHSIRKPANANTKGADQLRYRTGRLPHRLVRTFD